MTLGDVRKSLGPDECDDSDVRVLTRFRTQPCAARESDLAYAQMTVSAMGLRAKLNGVSIQRGKRTSKMVVPVMEEIVAVVQEVVRLVPQERVPQRTVEHVPVPRILEETVEVVRLVPQERVQQRIDEQMVELLIPRIVEVNVDVVRLVPQQRVQRICEQIVEVYFRNFIVDVFVPQVGFLEAPQFQVRAISYKTQGSSLAWTPAKKSF